MNTNDLYLEYARVIQMCKGTELEDTPWVCVKLDGEALRDDYGHPGLSASIEKYEFAIAVLEGKPVFVGDRLWLKDGHQFSVEYDLYVDPKLMSWIPTPKRTFTLNGVELPCPIPNTVKRDKPRVVINNVSFLFDLFGDAEKVRNEIINILTEARDKP